MTMLLRLLLGIVLGVGLGVQMAVAGAMAVDGLALPVVVVSGADPAGNVDSSLAIQTAVTQLCGLTPIGGPLAIPAGQYKIGTGITIPCGLRVYGSGPGGTATINPGSTTLIATAANEVLLTLTGSHAAVEHLFLTKTASTAGVTLLKVDASGNTQANYNTLRHLVLEGNGAADLLSKGLWILAGSATGCSGGACGAWYTTIDDVNVRFATDAIYLDGPTGASNGANATRVINARVGDGTTGIHIKNATNCSVVNSVSENNTTGVLIDTPTSTQNNNANLVQMQFLSSVTNDINVVDASSHFNQFYLAQPTTAKITDNGTGTGILGATANWKLPGAKYTDATDQLTVGSGNGVVIVSKAFASLGTPVNGTLFFCTDCTIANPCAAAGTGALAKRLNSVWVCN